MTKKKIIIYLLSLISILVLLEINFSLGKKSLSYVYYKVLSEKYRIIYKVLRGEGTWVTGVEERNKGFYKRFKKDYNIKFLPQTQFINVDFKKIKLNFLSPVKNNYSQTEIYTFYLEILENKIFIVDSKGVVFVTELNKIKENFNAQEIKSNLSELDTISQTSDVFIHNNKIFVSYNTLKEDCKQFKISFAELNDFKTLKFKNFFTSKECGFIQAGRMQFINFKNSKGLLVSLDDEKGRNSSMHTPEPKAQNINSIFGKIIFVDFKDKQYTNFSSGHRNPQGLLVEENLILSTEHGPRGGDEINKIEFNKNYGWPIASYGEGYFPKNNPVYIKNHNSKNFQEPIFSFVPSIGISEIIKLPDNFSKFWNNNYLIASLWGHHLYRVEFSDDYNKIKFFEKIFIGSRIRDIKYHNQSRSILMALEENGEIGLIKNSSN